MKTCSKCKTVVADPADLFCPHHARQRLLALERLGYLQPLHQLTINGPENLSPGQRFLTLASMMTSGSPIS